MHSEILLVDGFYNNPDDIRKDALADDYSVSGNYPGKRTLPKVEWINSLKSHFEGILNAKITRWNTEYNGAFQYCVEKDKTWIHADTNNVWSVMVYLSPKPLMESGTSFYQFKETGSRYWNKKDGPFAMDYGSDYSKWNEVDFIANVYNRAIFFRGDLWHAAKQPYFGKTLEDSRLFQTFFFDV